MKRKKETKMVKAISKISTTEKNDLDDLILQQDGLFCSVKTFYSI